jgi:hypothetical protein
MDGPDANPALHGERAANNCLSNGMDLICRLLFFYLEGDTGVWYPARILKISGTQVFTNVL